MRIALYEPNNGGHRYTHVKRLLPSLAELGEVIFVTSREGAASEEFRMQIEGVRGLCTLEASMPIGDPNDNQGYLEHMATHLLRCATDLGAEHVIMPYADGTTQIAGKRRLMGGFRLPKGVEIEALLMRGVFAYESGGGLKGWLRKRAWLLATGAAPFSVVHHMDPIVVRAIEREAPGLARRLRLIPDPVEEVPATSRADARRRLGIPQDGRYVGCVGMQDRRKGIDRLIRAYLAAGAPATDRLLLMGGHAPEITEILKGEAAEAVRQGRIVSVSRYITDEELVLGVAALDVVATPYPPDAKHSGSSSIVIHAAGQARPCLGCNYGWVGDTITRFKLGWTCDVMDNHAFAKAIRESLERSPGFALSEGGRRFVEFHRPANFASCFTRRLRERLGKPKVQALREWSWVMEGAGA